MDENIAETSGMASGLRKQVDEQVKANPSAEININGLIGQQEALIKRAEQSMVGQNVNNLANAKALMSMKAQLLAYKLAALYGQDGRAIAEGERQMFQAIAQGGNTTEKFVQNMSVLINGEINRLEGERNRLTNHSAIVGFENATGQKISNEAVQRLMGGDIRGDLMVDPRAKVAMEMMDKFNTLQVGNTQAPQAGQAEVTPPPQANGVAQPKTKAEYDALPPGTMYLHPDGTTKRKGSGPVPQPQPQPNPNPNPQVGGAW
jgi:hypothetical protein